VKFRIVAVGRVKSGPEKDLVDEYMGRIKRYCACELVELKNNDGERMLREASGATLIALDAAGEAPDSRGFARLIERYASQGKGVIAFVIGGAEGLPTQVRQAAHATWSLSTLTLPHRLARVVLAEQLYRAMTILRGEPYDK
jgi:23S rRNA (pseudouridine1915-N3)-methyltransferase